MSEYTDLSLRCVQLLYWFGEDAGLVLPITFKIAMQERTR